MLYIVIPWNSHVFIECAAACSMAGAVQSCFTAVLQNIATSLPQSPGLGPESENKKNEILLLYSMFSLNGPLFLNMPVEIGPMFS